MAKSPKCFDRLYVNMIKAGEAGGALETILQRLADFKERSEGLKRKVKGALIYPCVVVMVAVGIFTFIMIKIVPARSKRSSRRSEVELPAMTELLIGISYWVCANYWWAIPLHPDWGVADRQVDPQVRVRARMGWDLYTLKVPIFGQMVEKNSLARTTRTLGTLVSSGVPILEALNITRETAGNAVFEHIYTKVSESIREGESIAKPLKEHIRCRSSIPITVFFFGVSIPIGGILIYMMKARQRIVDDLVVNMVDVGEETGELDTMLYKVADTYDEEVKVLTDSLMSLMEPLIIVVLGGAVGFIVIALFIPLVKIITALT